MLDEERERHQKRCERASLPDRQPWCLLPTGRPGFLPFLDGRQHHIFCALCRAERFGTQFVEPGKRQDLRLAFRKEKFKKDGFKTGIDIYDEVATHKSHRQLCTFQAVPSPYEEAVPAVYMCTLHSGRHAGDLLGPWSKHSPDPCI